MDSSNGWVENLLQLELHALAMTRRDIWRLEKGVLEGSNRVWIWLSWNEHSNLMGRHGIRTFRSPVFSLLGVKVPSGKLRSQEQKFLGTFTPGNECSRELSFPGANVPGNFRSWYSRFMDNSPSNQFADNPIRRQPTRRQTNSPTIKRADKPSCRNWNCHQNRYKIVWAHGHVFLVNLRKKSGAISLCIRRYKWGNHIDSKHVHL